MDGLLVSWICTRGDVMAPKQATRDQSSWWLNNLHTPKPEKNFVRPKDRANDERITHVVAVAFRAQMKQGNAMVLSRDQG